jgi:uncharacterized protein (TIGR00251 family)
MDCLRETVEGVEIHLLVQPRSSQNRIEGISEGFLKIRLTQPPVEGLANKACLKLLSKELHIPQRHLIVAAGQKSRRKTVKISSYSAQEIRERLSRIL